MKASILCLMLAAVMQTAALSCSCGPRPPVPEAFAEASTVFAGRCISGKFVTKHSKDFGDVEGCQFTFEVTRIWKGKAEKKEITVETGIGWSDCGYDFKIGASYIVYCHEADGVLYTGICTRTCITNFERSVETEMKELDDAKAKAK
jgi:hypothetical protein